METPEIPTPEESTQTPTLAEAVSDALECAAISNKPGYITQIRWMDRNYLTVMLRPANDALSSTQPSPDWIRIYKPVDRHPILVEVGIDPYYPDTEPEGYAGDSYYTTSPEYGTFIEISQEGTCVVEPVKDSQGEERMVPTGLSPDTFVANIAALVSNNLGTLVRQH